MFSLLPWPFQQIVIEVCFLKGSAIVTLKPARYFYRIPFITCSRGKVMTFFNLSIVM